MRTSETRAIATAPRAERGAVASSQRTRPPSRTARPRPSVTDTRRDLLTGSTAIDLVGFDDLLDERVPDHIHLVQPDQLDPLNVGYLFHSSDQARGALR